MTPLIGPRPPLLLKKTGYGMKGCPITCNNLKQYTLFILQSIRKKSFEKLNEDISIETIEFAFKTKKCINKISSI